MTFACAVHVVLVIFVFLVYTSSSKLGSPKAVYEKLQAVVQKTQYCDAPLNFDNQACGPVTGNNGGSYLTMLSTGGLTFGIINIIGNFGTVFVDQVVYQSRTQQNRSKYKFFRRLTFFGFKCSLQNIVLKRVHLGIHFTL